VVSQRIYEFLKKGKQVYLDISTIKEFRKRFPSITSICEDNGIQISDGKIPVAPGSHFLMGGIKTDLLGRSSLDGLYAIGEAACTGLHGANRLASNSLLEGLFQGEKLSQWINEASKEPLVLAQDYFYPLQKEEKFNLPAIEKIKDLMMERVGIVRNKVNLKKQQAWLEQYQAKNIHLDTCSTLDMTKVFMLITASLITESAFIRTESRGGHFRSDFSKEEDNRWLRKSIIHNYKQGMEKSDEQIETALAT
jgi:L-aspartate oxidase